MNRKRTHSSPPPRPRSGFEGVVKSAVPVWLESDDGEPKKHYDTRVEFDDGSGPRRARVKLRPYEYLPPGALVRVRRSYSGQLSIEEEESNEEDAPGSSWKKPDIKSGVIALIIGVVIVASVAGSALLYLQMSQGEIEDIKQQQQERQNIDPSQLPTELLPSITLESPAPPESPASE